MGSGDHHRRHHGGKGVLDETTTAGEAAAAAAAVANNNEDGANNDNRDNNAAAAVALTTEDDIWATAEGYTPLHDMMHQSHDEEDGDGALFSDGTRTFMFSSGVPPSPGFFMDEDDESSSSSQSEEGVKTTILQQQAGDDHDDDEFRNIADRALLALENEYQATLLSSSRTTAAVAATSLDPPRTVAAATELDDDAANSKMEEEEEKTPSANFDADFSEMEATSTRDTKPPPQSEPATSAPPTNDIDIPNIDTDAVRRAVQSIQLRDPQLQEKISDWERQQKMEESLKVPRLHHLIPSQSLSAFRKDTARARTASGTLSRSATIAEALIRLQQQHHLDVFPRCNEGNNNNDVLTIHVVGCDHVECATEERIRGHFRPFVKWLNQFAECPKRLHLDLVGPNLTMMPVLCGPEQREADNGDGGGERTTSSSLIIDLLPSPNTTNNAMTSPPPQRLESATVHCHRATYEQWLRTKTPENERKKQVPNLAIAFNAGIWGYDEWETTVEYLVASSSSHRFDQKFPFVFTAYTLQEAEDDYDVIARHVKDKEKNCLWEPEMNAFGSKQERETANAAPGRCYRENAAWQCWQV